MSGPYQGQSNDANVPAISGENTAGQNSVGVKGVVHNLGWGVLGESTSGTGVVGLSKTSYAIYAKSDATGILAESTSGDGVFGTGRRGVVGVSDTFQGVYGKSRDNAGVVGESQSQYGVFGITHSSFAGVIGINDAGGTGVAAQSSTGIGVHATGGRLAGLFEGNVEVTGDITLTGADFAEEFDIAATSEAEPGTVMVLDEHGALQPSQQAYDKRVAGVISGAGDYKPGLILDKKGLSEGRVPVALVGKVYCKVDAHYASIEVGDLLTTCPTPGHAMKAVDPLKAFGAIIGKALRPLDAGCGLIPILVTFQ